MNNTVALDILTFGAILSGILVITSRNPVISVVFLISVFINVAGYLLLIGVSFIGISYLIIYVGAIAILFLFVVMMMNIKLVELTSVGQEYTKGLPLGVLVGSLFFYEILALAPIDINNLRMEMVNRSFIEIMVDLFNIYNLTSLDKNNLNSVQYNNTESSSIMNTNNSDVNLFLPLQGYERLNDVMVSSTNDFDFIHWDNSIISFQQIETVGQSIYTIYTMWFIIASLILLLAMIGPIILCLKSASTSATTNK